MQACIVPTSGSSYAASVAATDASCAEAGRMPRSRSAEDLSQEQLKTTESDTVLIFIEYVRNKLDKNSHPRAADLDAELAAEGRTRRETARARQEATSKGSLRRLHSEPNGPRSSEYAPPSTRNGDDANNGVRQVPATSCEVAATYGRGAPRPTALVLDRPPSNRDERRQRASATARSISNASTGSDTATPSTTDPTTAVPPYHHQSSSVSSATTPVPIPDPPLCVAGVSPSCDGGSDFASSYPPLSAHRLSSPAIIPPTVVAGRPVSQEYFCTAQQPLTPQMSRAVIARDSKWRRQHHAKIIANKLKIFGDEISSTHEEQLQQEFIHLVNTHTNPQQVVEFFSYQLRHMMVGLSWQTIGKVFHLSYHLIQILTALLGPSANMTASRAWTEFSDLWDFTIGSVTRWISSNGGWRAFPADSTTTSAVSPDQPSCPATPSFQRVRSRLLSLSESGEFEFIDEEGHPLSADTISTTSSDVALSDDREDQMGSSVDLLHDPIEGSASEASLTTSPLFSLNPTTVPPPCAPLTSPPTHHTHNHAPNHTHPSPKKTPKRKSKSKSSSAVAPASSSSTVAFSNGIPQLQEHSLPSHTSRTLPKKKSHSVKERSTTSSGSGANNREELEGHLSRTGSLPAGAIRRSTSGSSGGGSGSSGRRTSQTAFNGLMIGVGGAAVVYAAVSALMRR